MRRVIEPIPASGAGVRSASGTATPGARPPMTALPDRLFPRGCLIGRIPSFADLT